MKALMFNYSIPRIALKKIGIGDDFFFDEVQQYLAVTENYPLKPGPCENAPGGHMRVGSASDEGNNVPLCEHHVVPCQSYPHGARGHGSGF